ncbi:MAG: hypothetical protein Q9166_000767 [cf. Caloplaca sp. 2 TL-2023]
MGDSSTTTDSTSTDQQIKALQEQVKIARGYERLLKATLVSLNATSSSNDLHANIIALEIEKEELTERLEDFRSGKVKPVPLKEKERVDKALDDWTRKANSRKQIFMDLWAIVRDELPEPIKGHLWSELGLESDSDGVIDDMEEQ